MKSQTKKPMQSQRAKKRTTPSASSKAAAKAPAVPKFGSMKSSLPSYSSLSVPSLSLAPGDQPISLLRGGKLKNNPYMAPAGISMLTSGPRMSFRKTSRGVAIRFFQPFCGLGIDAQPYSGQNCSLLLSVASAYGGAVSTKGMPAVSFNPCRMITGHAGLTTYTLFDAYMDSTFLPIQGFAWSRWKWTSDVEFCYEPQCTTTLTNRHTLAWSTDFDHPVYGLGSLYNNTNISEAAARSSASVVSFATWAPMHVSFPTDQKSEYYTYTHSRAGGSIHAYDRLSQGGLICGISNTAGTQRTDGVLYIGGEIEFFDPSPIIGGISYGPQLIHRLMSGKAFEPDSEKKKEEEGEVASDSVESKEEKKLEPTTTSEPSDDDGDDVEAAKLHSLSREIASAITKSSSLTAISSGSSRR